MADNIQYPLTQLRFEVKWKGGNGSFSEVSGLTVETAKVEYRGGLDTSLTVRKLPGLMTYSDITLSRGIIKKDNDFWLWWSNNQLGKHEMRDIEIDLQDEAGAASVTWSIVRAWPLKVEGPSLNAKGTDVAVEKLVFVHEGITIKHV
jgi:phage tail-like protein